MKIKLLLSIIFITLFLTSCQEGNNSMTKVVAKYTQQDCLDIYDDILVTGKELIIDSLYITKDFQNFETIKIDTSSSSALHINYQFKVNDSVSDFYMAIGTLMYFEKSEDAAKQSYNIAMNAMLLGPLHKANRLEQKKIEELDSLISFGEISQFIGYKNNNHLKGYTIIGRTKNIVLNHTIISNHIEHFDYVEILNGKIKTLVEFAEKHEK